MRRNRTLRALLPCLFLMLLGRNLAATDRPFQELQAAQLLPQTTLLYAEFPDPSGAMDLILEHPLRKQVEQLDPYKRAVAARGYLNFVVGLTFVEFRLGMTWRKALATVAQGGIYASFDGQSGATLMLVRAQDERSLVSFKETLRGLAREEAAGRNKPDPIREADHRGVAVLHSDQGASCILGPWLALSNNAELLKGLVNRALDAGQDSLAAQEPFRAARAAEKRPSTIWLYANLDAIRQSGAASGLFTGRTDNPASELLVGGLLDVLRKAPFATASLRLSRESLSLEAALPHQPGSTTPEREYYFGPLGAGTAAPVPHAEETIFSLTTYRDLAGMWVKAGDLFDANVNDQIAQAESGLTTLFSGKDFGDDILGALAPRLQVIVARQKYEQGVPQPAIRLPAFALVLEMKQAEATRKEMRRIFQSLIGFLNIVGAMNGQPQLDLDSEKLEGAELVTSSYISDPARDQDGQAKINFNFSPTVAFRGPRMVVSSTRGLARQLVSPDRAAPPAGAGSEVAGLNTAMRLDVGALRAILEDNRGQLISQNMLAEGRTREEAQQQIDAIFSAMSFVREALLQLTATDGRLSLELTARLAEAR
jgi:hypothetical protein